MQTTPPAARRAQWDTGMATPQHTPSGRGYDTTLICAPRRAPMPNAAGACWPTLSGPRSVCRPSSLTNALLPSLFHPCSVTYAAMAG